MNGRETYRLEEKMAKELEMVKAWNRGAGTIDYKAEVQPHTL